LYCLALLAVPGLLASQGAADEPGIYGYVLAPGSIPVSGETVASRLPSPQHGSNHLVMTRAAARGKR
jgi:hypothetical protein